jgi:uncharacterized membrane protein YbhN (UPF0104 family)
MNRAKVHKIFSILLKTGVLLLSLAYIFYKIFYNQDIGKIGTSISIACDAKSFFWVLGVMVLLMAFNWAIETYKWRYLILKLERISFYTSLKAVLVGITFSSFTPNRVGDYFGRALMLENSDKRSGFLITVVGSIAQTIVTIVLGTIGIILIGRYMSFNDLGFENMSFIFFKVILVVFNVLLLLFYFKISFLKSWIQRIKMFNKISAYFEVLSSYTYVELLNVLLLSLTRYVVFVFQFYLLLFVFDIHIAILDGMALISAIYLVTTIVPTIALTELGVKSAAAIYFFEMYFKNSNNLNSIALGVVAATFALWVINLAIPALVGSIYVLKMKPFKKPIND